MKFKSISAIILAGALLMTGCASKAGDTTSKGSETKAESSQSAVTYPIVIKHAFGETKIEKEPKNVATVSWSNQDVPLALGVVPVGVSKANYGKVDENGLLPWTAAKYKELGVTKPVVYDDVDGLNFEAISNSHPDVILAAYSGMTQDEYNTLSQIAPVVPYEKNAWQTYWRDQINTNATAMGKKDEGEKLVSDLDTLIKEKAANYKNIKGKTAAFCYISPSDLGKIYVYLPTDPRAAYLNDLGLETPEFAKELAKTSTDFSVTISAENIEKLKDVDVIVTYGDEALLKQMQADSLLGTVPAIKNGSVALIENNSALAASCTPSALSIPATLDDYLKIIGNAADKVK